MTDPEQARLLTDAEAQRMFRPLLARELTATQLAAETGRDLNAVLYRLRQFLRAGLVRVVREVKRAGRPIKVYRSAHDAYFVPYELTPFASLEERMLEQLLPTLRERVRLQARRLTERGWHGQALYRDDAGEVWTESAGDPEARLDWLDPRRGIGLDYITTVRLTADEARALQALLLDALERFGRRPVGADAAAPPSAARYEFSVALVPLDEP